MAEREHLGRVREGNRPFARGVERIEEVDEERDETEMGIARHRDEEAQSCGS